MKNIIFLAPPAAGKGTISNFLKETYGYQHISSGKIFRERIKQNENQEGELNEIIKSGKLVNDELLFRCIKEKLQIISKEKYFILDGVPRTLQQAKFLDIILRDLGFLDYIVINIKVKKEILHLRFTGRRICPNCQKTYNIFFEKFKPHKKLTCDDCGLLLKERVDDTEESFRVRYETFVKNNEEIVKYYKEKNCLYELDYNDDDQATLKEIQRIVGAFVDK